MSAKALLGLSYTSFTGIWALGQFGKARPIIWRELSSELRHCRKKRKVPVQTPLGTWLGLGTQPRYEAPGDVRIENVKTQWLTLVE